jgi:hypothetical protein
MVAGERVKSTKLTPTLTESWCRVAIETTDVSTHQWNPKQIEIQKFCDTGQNKGTRLMASFLRLLAAIFLYNNY